MPVPIERIAGALGAEIAHGQLDGALARMVCRDDRVRIRLSDRHDHPGQVRFSIAHELGHLVLGHTAAVPVASDAVAFSVLSLLWIPESCRKLAYRSC